ncbi:MAG: hypothetical protein ACE5IR_08905 [bacterium]
MRNSFLVLGILSCALWVSSLSAQQREKQIGEIKYISKHTVYINLGSKQGLSVGDTVAVKRQNRRVGDLVVEHVSRLSAACRAIVQLSDIKQGDRVEILLPFTDSQPKAPKQQRERQSKRTDTIPQKQNRLASESRKKEANRIRGRIAVQTLWFDDMGAANLDYTQLALRTSLKVQHFLGMPLELRFRWRSRGHHRERVLSSEIADKEWTHNVYELSFVYENASSPFEFGFGRILSHRIRGLGYIDGGLVSVRMNDLWRIGLAGGTQPSLRGSNFQTDEQKFGFFINFEKGEYRSQRISSTIAFSGRYHGGVTSREFVYLQNNFSYGSKFSVYQTVEMDLNRGWKNTNGRSSIQFSNVYLSARYAPSEALSLTASYDARKNVRVYETRTIPDSLFDETTRQGLHTGFTLRLPHRMRLSGNFGMRFRKGNLKNTTFASGALSVRNVFHSRATLQARFSYFSTMFTKGYRPNIHIRVPVARTLSLNLGTGSYIYQTGSRITNNYWFEIRGTYRITRRLFADFGYRGFLDERLKSKRVFLETGVVF